VTDLFARPHPYTRALLRGEHVLAAARERTLAKRRRFRPDAQPHRPRPRGCVRPAAAHTANRTGMVGEPALVEHADRGCAGPLHARTRRDDTELS